MVIKLNTFIFPAFIGTLLWKRGDIDEAGTDDCCDGGETNRNERNWILIGKNIEVKTWITEGMWFGGRRNGEFDDYVRGEGGKGGDVINVWKLSSQQCTWILLGTPTRSGTFLARSEVSQLDLEHLHLDLELSQLELKFLLPSKAIPIRPS
jgi:hypothetical protein